MHFILSYSELSDDLIDNYLKKHFPDAGLFIRHGKKELDEFNLWVNKYLLIDEYSRPMIQRSEVFREGFIENLLGVPEEQYEEEILPIVVDYLSPIVPPEEVTTFVDKLTVVYEDDFDRSLFDSVFDDFIEFVQVKLRELNIKRISISSEILLEDYKLEPEWVGKEIYLNEPIDIEQYAIYLRSEEYPLNIDIFEGNVRVYNGDLICTHSLTYDQFIDFLSESGKEVLEELGAYELRQEDKDILLEINRLFS